MKSKILERIFLNVPWLISGLWFSLFSAVSVIIVKPLIINNEFLPVAYIHDEYTHDAFLFILGTGILGALFGSILRDLLLKSQQKPVYKDIFVTGCFIFLISLILTAIISVIKYEGKNGRIYINEALTLALITFVGWAGIELLLCGWVIVPLGGFASFLASKIFKLNNVSKEYKNDILKFFIEREYIIHKAITILSLTPLLFCILILVITKIHNSANILWYLLFDLMNIISLLCFFLIPLVLYLSFLSRNNGKKLTRIECNILILCKIIFFIIWLLICFYIGFIAIFSVSGPG